MCPRQQGGGGQGDVVNVQIGADFFLGIASLIYIPCFFTEEEEEEFIYSRGTSISY